MAAQPSLLTVSEYTVLPIFFPPQPSHPVAAIHYIYLRPHSPKIPEPDSPRSLFLVNIPIDSTEIHFRSLFADQLGGGRLERVDFDTTRPAKHVTRLQPDVPGAKKRKRADVETEELVPQLPEVWDRQLHRSGSTAVVVFVDRPSMELGLKAVKRAAKTGTEVVWGKGVEDKVPKLGSASKELAVYVVHGWELKLMLVGYRTHHALRFPSKTLLQESVDTYMTQFSAQEAARARSLAHQRQVPDADGFVTVTRGGRTGPARIEEAKEKLEREKERDKEKKEGMGDFYRFQVRERKKERAGELVRKFEQDRRRVDEMRRGRRGQFMPM